MLAYFDCFCGISGDMTLGAFIDLGVPVPWLKEQIERLPLTDFDLTVSPVSKHGIRGQHVRVEATDSAASRSWTDIRHLIQNSPLPEGVRSNALAIFEKIAVAEAGIHGSDVNHVHFHEVGGVDAIVDIVGTALCLDYLGIERVAASKIPLGSGTVKCEHGTLPVPAPATLSILENIPVYGADIRGENVTPTGAAIVAALATAFGPMPEMRVRRTGYGAGTRDFSPLPNLLRICMGDLPAGRTHLAQDHILIVETCIDDMNPEIYGYLMDRLFLDGALDVYWLPVYMKKNRPGTMIRVLCPEEARDAVSRRILSETTSTGVRYFPAHRIKLPRESVEVDTSFGKIRVKRITGPEGDVSLVPEYEVCRDIADTRGIPIRQVYRQIEREVSDAPD